jgi:hypothetical protein
LPTLNQFVIEAAVILRRGPILREGETSVVLSDDPKFTVTYERHEGEIRETIQITGAPGGGGEQFQPPGVLRLKVFQEWSVSVSQEDYDRKLFQLNPDQEGSRGVRVAHAVQTAMIALEACTDSYVESWGSFETTAYWLNATDQRVNGIYASASLEQHAVTFISASDSRRYSQFLWSFASNKRAAVRAAYSIARLRREHLAPAARVVFIWALLERITRQIFPNRTLSHKAIEGEVLKICNAAIAQEAAPIIEQVKVKQAIQKAYKLRNGLAHGEPKASVEISFPELSRAVTLMLRRLGSNRP